MAIATYNHFANGVTIRGVPIAQAYPGRVFWVSNSTVLPEGGRPGSDLTSLRGTMLAPFATISYAISRCVAGRGDTIVVGAGHAETITAAAGIAMSKAGVCLLGLGTGLNRPTITYTTANTATMTVTAANCSIVNIRFVANFLSIARAIGVTATDLTIERCDFSDTDSTHNFLNIVNCTGAANTANRLAFLDNKVVNQGVTSNNTTILTANDIDGLEIKRNYLKWAILNDMAIACIVTAGVLTNVQIVENIAIRPNTSTTGGSLLNVGGTTSTGVMARNFVGTLCTTDVICTTNVGISFFENYVTGVITTSGYIIPARDS